MTYFPPKTEPVPFKCEACGDWFVRPNSGVQVSCCVLHPPGTCCHMNETKVDDPPQRLAGDDGEAPAPGAASEFDLAPPMSFAEAVANARRLIDAPQRIAELESRLAALQREHAATLAEWGARIEGLLAERAVYANQVAEMGGLLERVEPLADFAALAKPEALLAADLMGVESMEEAEQCSDEWMEINTAVRDYVAIHVSPLGGGE